MKKIAIQGIPFDRKSSFLRGPALAPPLIRHTLLSEAYNSFAENGIDINTEQIVDKGDFTFERYNDIKWITTRHLEEGYRLLTLGGDHSITYPILNAYAKHYSSIQILHIDAHGDLYDEFDGDRYSHACPFARIMEEGLADRLFQVGIRALNAHQREQAERFGVEIMGMKDLDLDQLPTFEGGVYISMDMDALDPAFAPGVSHQEAGGLTSREVIRIIQSVEAPVIGADIVEYNPTRDVSNITAALAAKLMKEILSKMLER